MVKNPFWKHFASGIQHTADSNATYGAGWGKLKWNFGAKPKLLQPWRELDSASCTLKLGNLSRTQLGHKGKCFLAAGGNFRQGQGNFTRVACEFCEGRRRGMGTQIQKKLFNILIFDNLISTEYARKLILWF